MEFQQGESLLNHPGHDAILANVEEDLKSKGYLILDTSGESHKGDFWESIRWHNSPFTKELRTECDRAAYNPETKHGFFFDAKADTAPWNEKHVRIIIEVEQIARAKERASRGVYTYLILGFTHTSSEYLRVIRADAFPAEEAWLHNRHETYSYYTKMFNRLYPGIAIVQPWGNGNDNDPKVIAFKNKIVRVGWDYGEWINEILI